MTNHRTSPKFSAEMRERAVRTMLEHRGEHASTQWAAIVSIAAKIGCTQTLSREHRTVQE